MYMLKNDLKLKINQKNASLEIGISEPTMSNIMTRKVACRKVVAYCITKYIDENAEITDFFEKVR